MDTSEFKIIRQIFSDALGCDAEARAPFVEKACEGDDNRLREVEQLLAAHDSAHSWVDGQVAQSIIRATAVTLKPGEKIGSYEILGLLGVGGMGEVYRAQDTSLASRHVAIKVLPDAFSRDPERVGRFEREALVLASLNHANIGAIHHVVEDNESRFLVLELVEGETLAARISRGALSLEETLPLAREIVDALDYAHDKGVVHRDLKPGNIMVTPDDHVKVLDFGLAKVRDDSGNDHKKSVTFGTTEPSRILGTAPYMSPEQASGKEADRRSDIWAFGCLLYEMLTGHVLFTGESVSEILAEVLKSEPDFKGLPRSTPPAIRRLLRRCLQKDRKLRLRHIGDARLEIEDAAAGIEEASEGVVPLRTMSRREWIAWATAAVAAVAGAGASAWFATRRSTRDGPRIRFARYVTLPTLDPLSLAISPDGEKIVFAATTATESQLWLLKPAESETPTVLPGTLGAYLPFWSPDSQWVGFFANSQLKKTRIDGGLPENLVRLSLGRGGTWSSSGKILYAGNPGTWISMVDAQTTEVQKVTQLERGHVSHRFPQFVDDSHFLYQVTGKAEVGGIYSYDLKTKMTSRLLFSPAGKNDEVVETAVFAPPGFLLFLIQGKLYVQDFDAKAMTLVGERSLVKDVNQSARVMVNTAISRAALSVARDCLIYRTGSAPGERQLSWRDATGRDLGLVGSSDIWGPLNPSLSPDGSTVILDRTAVETGNTDIFRINATPRATGSVAAEYVPLTTHEKPDYSPVWSPSGGRFVYSNSENGPWDLYEMQLRGGGSKLIKSTEESKFASDWSSDGAYILYRSINPEGGYDLRALHYATGQEVAILPKGNPADERDGQFSRDMKWIAYASNERDDRFEIYVVPFSRDSKDPTDGGEKISAGGGTQPRWGRQIRGSAELFYLNSTGSLMRVLIAVSSDGTPSVVEPPVKLFNTGIPAENPVGAYGQQYAVRIDGDTVRFLLNVPKVVEPQPLHLISGIDWTSR